MTSNDKEIVDKLQIELTRIDREIELAQKDMDRLVGRKKQILDEIAKHTDEEYEDKILSLVYEQRKKNK